MEKWACPRCGCQNDGNFCVSCGSARDASQAVGPDGGLSPFVATFETGRHYKVHKSYVWLGPLVAELVFIVIAAVNSIQGIVAAAKYLRESEIGSNVLAIVLAGIGALVLLYFILVGLYALAYKNMSFVFDAREFSFYSGVITKRRVHLPYARVQSVNHRASIIQRLAGVCTVTIDSAGGSSNKALRVPYLRLETAERMRVDLFVRKAAVEAGLEQAVAYDPNADPASLIGAQAEAERVRQNRAAAPVAPGAPNEVPARPAGLSGPAGVNVLDAAGGVVGQWRGVYGGQVAGLEPVSFEYGLTNGELVLTSLSHSTPLAMAVSIGLSALVVIAGVALADDAFSHLMVTMFLPVSVGITLVSWLMGVIGVALSYGNFRARRRGSRIEVERGLLQRDFSGIDIARVQSIEIRQSLIRRLIGYCEISLGRINAGGDDAGKQNNSNTTHGLVIHPFVKIDRVDEVLDGLVPEMSDRPRVEDLASLPAPALRRSILRRCVWYNAGLYTLIALGVFVVLVNGTRPELMPVNVLAVLHAIAALIAVLCVAYTVARAFGAVLWAKNSGYTWNRNYVMLHNDGLSVERAIIPRQKIQSGSTRSNPFQRRLALTGMSAVTAAGTRSTSATLIDIPAEAGAAYLDWLKPRH